MLNEKLPDDILDLRKERDDINLLLTSLQDQYNSKQISKSEYDNFKQSNEKRLREIERLLDKEWKKLEKRKPEDGEPQTAMSPQAQEVVAKMDEVKQAFEKPQDQKQGETPETSKEAPKEISTAPKKQEEPKPEEKTETKPAPKKSKAKKKPKPNKGKMKILRDIK